MRILVVKLWHRQSCTCTDIHIRVYCKHTVKVNIIGDPLCLKLVNEDALAMQIQTLMRTDKHLQVLNYRFVL